MPKHLEPRSRTAKRPRRKVSPLRVVEAFLTRIDHTGPNGFEGLVTILLEQVTGQRFRLAASGQQDGRDATSESGYGNRIMVEAKHYTKASLDARELTAEIRQAKALGSGLDLWVLAASCPVSAQLAEMLETIAAEDGIETLFLDKGVDEVPRLVALMAAYPEVVARWAGKHQKPRPTEQLRNALEQIQSDGLVKAVQLQVRNKLTSTLLGYEDARKRARGRLLQAILDRDYANLEFKQHVAVRDTSLQSISRHGPQMALDDWWHKLTTRNAAVLGEEGSGKTWVAMNWLADHLEKDNLPIVLAFSASAQPIGPLDTLDDLLPVLLKKWTGIGTEHAWSERLRKWRASEESTRPQILVVADGLNEKARMDWSAFFRSTEASHSSGGVAVLATDRTIHWNDRCKKGGISGFTEIPIEGYTDAELEIFLTRAGIRLQDIPAELYRLIRKPLYCQLVVDHYNEMRSSFDFTKERLLFIHYRTRQASRSNVPLSDDEFIEIIRALALKWRKRERIGLFDVQRLLPEDPDRQIYQEIVDCGLLVRNEGLQATYRVEHVRLVFGLGMLLAEELKQAAEANSADLSLEEALSRWFEPHPAMDLKVEICGAAIFHALLDERYPASGRRVLLRYWLASRNWQHGMQEAYVDYLLRCPEDFLAVAEEFWSSHRDLGTAQDFFAAALVKHRDHPIVQPLLVKTVTRWMGFVHPLGPPIFRHDAATEARARQEIESRVGHPLASGRLEIAGESLYIVEDERLLTLVRFAVLIMSAGPRMPFIRCLIPWSVASVLMGGSPEANAVDWVVRLATEDLEAALMPEINRLLSRGEDIATQAAVKLLHRIGSKESHTLIAAHPVPEHYSVRLWKLRHQEDPCTSGLPWNDHECQSCVEREHIAVRPILNRLQERAFDPGFELSNRFLARVVATLNAAPDAVKAGPGYTSIEHDLETVTPVLGARRPAELSGYIRQIVASLPDRPLGARYYLALWLQELSPILSEAELRRVLSALQQLWEGSGAWPSIEQDGPEYRSRTAEAFLFLGVAPQVSADAFVRAWLARPAGAWDLVELAYWFRPISDDLLHEIWEVVHRSEDKLTLFRVLWILSLVKPALRAIDRERLISLAQSDEAMVRGAVMHLACESADAELGSALVDLGRSYLDSEGTWEGEQGTRLLISFGVHLPFEQAAACIHPAAAGHLLKQRGYLQPEVLAYAAALNEVWEASMTDDESRVLQLPKFAVRVEDSGLGIEPPQFVEENDTGVVMRDRSTSWTAGPPMPPLEKLSSMQSLDAEEHNRIRRQQFDVLRSAWKSPGLLCFGRRFSHEALGQVYRAKPEVVLRWIEIATSDGLVGHAMRVRMGTFLADLCQMLLREDPARGCALLQALHEDKNSSVSFDAAEYALYAAAHPATDSLCYRILCEASTDDALSKFAFLSGKHDRHGWLSCVIDRLLTSQHLCDRARGLTLASYMDVTTDGFALLLGQAQIDGTWVEAKLDWFRTNVRRNELAKYWYRRFLAEESPDRFWGALQVVRACGDKRFYLWREEGEAGQTVDLAYKLAFLRVNARMLGKDFDRSKERRDTLFGFRIQKGEMYPFMDA